MQYKSIHYNAIRYNAIGYGTRRDDTIRYDRIRYDTIRDDTRRDETIRYGTVRYGTVRYDTTRHDTIRYDTIQYDTRRDETIRYCTVQYDTIEYKTTLLCRTLSCSCVTSHDVLKYTQVTAKKNTRLTENLCRTRWVLDGFFSQNVQFAFFLSKNAFRAEMLSWFSLQFELTKLRLLILMSGKFILWRKQIVPRAFNKSSCFSLSVFYTDLRTPDPGPSLFI